MRSLISGLAALAAVAVLAIGSLGASASTTKPTTQHDTWTANWQWDTSVWFNTSAVCPLFPGNPSGYTFSDVNLTLSVKSTIIPNDSLWRFKSIGRVAGELYGPDGTYTVTSGPLREDRIGDFSITFFLGNGPVTITGPGGTVSGAATFLDMTHDNGNMHFEFTSITRCQLN